MRCVITSAFFLGLAFSSILGEAIGGATPPGAYKSVADPMHATATRHGTREVATRRIAQNAEVPVSDPQAGELAGAQTTTPPVSTDTVCQTLKSAAQANDLPLEFLVRLIWQESRFDPHAVSPAGAQGVAQFMPKTAAWRGLENPFDPIQAISKSAELLRTLWRQFGNLGLAAAAYNAGPKRVQDWLAGRQSLPQETRTYVRIVTGRTAEEWTTAKSNTLNVTLPDGVPCPQIATLLPKGQQPQKTSATPSRSEAVWAVQLFGDSSQTNVLAAYNRLQKTHASILGNYQPLIVETKVGKSAFWYRARVAANSRESAERLCSSLRKAGGSCLVQRN